MSKFYLILKSSSPYCDKANRKNAYSGCLHSDLARSQVSEGMINMKEMGRYEHKVLKGQRYSD